MVDRTKENNPFYGKRHSKLTKKNISRCLSGRKHNYHPSTEFKKGHKINLGRKRIMTKQHRKNLSMSKRGEKSI